MQGTYVNDCRIQNAAVRLTSGDKIRFGYAGPAFSFTVIPSPGPSASAIQVFDSRILTFHRFLDLIHILCI